MSIQEEIEYFALQKLGVLQDRYNFTAPKVKREGWLTRVYSTWKGLAVELEIDWREFDVFLLIVRLEKGRLPKGYYVFSGRECRVHLINLIERKGWTIDQTLISRIHSILLDPRRREATDLQTKIDNYFELLLSCIDQILVGSYTLFK